MKLIIEKHPDISQLTHYFQKIEALAYDQGMEVDELLSTRAKENSSNYFFKESQSEIAKHRSSVFRSGWQIIR